MSEKVTNNSYFEVLRRAMSTDYSADEVLHEFERLNTQGIDVEYDALFYAVFTMKNNTNEIITWLTGHGHGHYGGYVPFHAEEYLMRDVISSTIKEEIFPVEIWLGKLEALLRGGINPNPVIENDYGHSMRLIDYVSRYAMKGNKNAIKVLPMLLRYDD
jgi:hypothetical protein